MIIDGTPGRDVLTGTGGDDVITGFGDRDTITGGGGDDTFVYTSIVDGYDVITDFEIGSDKIDLVGVLNDLGFAGDDPIAEGYIGFIYRPGRPRSRERPRSPSTVLTIDPDGSAGPEAPIPLLSVGGGGLDNPDNFIF